MVRHDLDADQAYAMLRDAARRHELSVDVLARRAAAVTVSLR